MKKLTATALAVATAGTLAITVSADEPYTGYLYDWWSDPIPSQCGFVVDRTISGADMGVGSLSEPNDIFIDNESGTFYIADSKNNRIIVTDETFKPENTRVIDTLTYGAAYPESESSIQKTTFASPTGIYVRTDKDDNTLIYVADSSNQRVVAFNEDLEIEMEYVRPSSDVYDAQVTYNPSKVVVDSAFNVYVVVPSITQGTVQFSADGTFNGYYGANRVNATAEVIAQAFWKLIYTRDQIIAMRRSVAIEIANVDVDEEGFIYTVTESRTSDTDILKKLNPAGTNIFTNLGYDEIIFGDVMTVYYKGKNYTSAICDVDIDEEGNIYLLDFATGRVFQYTDECDLLFIFGGKGTQKGTFTSVSALETHNGKVYVTDSRKNNITVFKGTEFGNIVQNAIELYNEGLYDEAKEPWEEVLRRDGNYWLAYIGLGNAYLNQNDYATALSYFYRNSRAGYNRAFKSYRIEFIRANFTWIMIVILVVILALIVISKVRQNLAKKKSQNKTGGTNT
ncbi:MAG: hypothetical protein NC084_02225 [Bacteroides sp.]|nr:hypothetical protein [Eubacterium sp.]MCM1461512.1 hypothetical protein [Bacteroides sp.]